MPSPFTLPTIPAELQAIIDRDRDRFAGWTMSAGPTEPPAQDGAGPTNPPNPAPTPPPAAVPPAKPADITDEAWTALGDPGKRAIVAERAKADAEKQRADTLQKQIDDAKLTTEQKAAADLEAAKAEGTEAKGLVEKYRIAAAKGLDLSLAERLVGSTTAELEADADKLKTLLGAKPGTPAPDPSQGHGGGGGDKPASVAEVVAERRAAREAKSKTN
jgi:hypothetical protein